MRLLALAPPARWWAKIEFLGSTGSVYDRVASRRVRPSPRPVVVAGSALFATAIAAAAQRLGRPVRAVIPETALDEHHTLLLEARVAVWSVPAAELAAAGAREAEQAGAELITGSLAADFSAVLGAELRAEIDALAAEVRPDAILVPAEGHGLAEGLGASGSGLPVIRAIAAPGAGAFLELAESGPGLAVTADAARAARTALAAKEGLLVGYGAAAALAAAARAPAQRPLVLLTDAGDRVFSRDRRLEAR